MKLYNVYTNRGELILTDTACNCAKFMGLNDDKSFHAHIWNHENFGTVTKYGFYATVSDKQLQLPYEITSVERYRLKKDILVPQTSSNGLKKLVRIKKGKAYKWDRIVYKGTILLAKTIEQDRNMRRYIDVIKLKKSDLNKYFTKEV